MILLILIQYLQHTYFKNNNNSILILLNKSFFFRKKEKKENMNAFIFFTIYSTNVTNIVIMRNVIRINVYFLTVFFVF